VKVSLQKNEPVYDFQFLVSLLPCKS